MSFTSMSSVTNAKKQFWHFCILTFNQNQTHMKLVKQILASKTPYLNIVDADAKVFEALVVMKRENLSYAIVLERGSYVGIISEKDYAHKVALLGRSSDATKVRDIMVSDYPIINNEDSSNRCLIFMNTFSTRYLPVFNESEFKGVITMHDILREVGSEKDQERILSHLGQE